MSGRDAQPEPQSLEALREEVDGLRRYADEREQRLRDLRLGAEITALAGKVRLRDPDFAFLICKERDLVQFDEDTGKPLDVEAALHVILDERPYLREPVVVALRRP